VFSRKRNSVVTALLKHFRANAGRTITREELATTIWRLKLYPASRTIDMAVCSARKQLNHGERITAVHGRGYCYQNSIRATGEMNPRCGRVI
jgi:DNA-binding response OmpR family regulator